MPYASASVLAAFGIVYRYSMWLRRPPTRMYVLCFALNAGLLLYVFDFDRRLRRASPRASSFPFWYSSQPHVSHVT